MMYKVGAALQLSKLLWLDGCNQLIFPLIRSSPCVNVCSRKLVVRKLQQAIVYMYI